MLGNATGGLVAYYIGIAIVALPGLIGVILIGRLHRAALRDSLKLKDEVSRAEEATGHIRCLLSDIMATMNLSLALCAAKPDAGREKELEEIRLAAEEAIKAHRQPVEVRPRPAGLAPQAAPDVA
ncbi:MAG TPA: hypothetical protein VMY87_09670 [Armatimonadota bacterium]|nr:hypothetical protein [Armatimonadota bacterium]